MKWVLDTGNHIAALAAKYARVQVIPIYPITPQTSIAELLSEFIERGEMKARLIRVESEHSAMAAAIGASLFGARTFTATSSHGLALMHEMLHWATGARTPIVMAVVNRALGPPWSIWTEYTDTMSQRDTGWIQAYVISNQEIFDTIIQAYKIAENRKVMLPFMVCFEGFTISHTAEPVSVPEQEEIDDFLPSYEYDLLTNFDNPLTLGNVAFPDDYFKMRESIEKSMREARNTIISVCSEYSKKFGQDHGFLIQPFFEEESNIFIVTLGGVAGEAMDSIKILRNENIKAGLVRIRFFRPFPKEELREILRNAELVVTLDRSTSFGADPQVFCEVKSALYGLDVPVYGAIVGLGGKEIDYFSISQIVKHMMRIRKEQGKMEYLRWYMK